MDVREALEQATDAVLEHPRRSIGAGVGTFLGAAILTVLLAWSSGFRDFMRGELMSYGRGSLWLTPRATSSDFPGFRGGVAVRFARRDLELAESSSVDAVEAVLPQHQSRERMLAEVEGTYRQVDVSGVDPRFFALRSFEVEHGHLFTARDLESFRPVAVLGAEIAAALFGSGRDAIGGRVRIEGHAFEVVGVTRRKSRQYINPSRPDNELVIVPITSAESRLGFDAENVHRVDIYPRSGAEPERALDAVLAVLGPRSGFSPRDTSAYQWADTARLVRLTDAMYLGFTVFLSLCGVIILAIGGVGIANHQLTVLGERSVELAVARALGARRRDLILVISIESLLLSLSAALSGVIAAAAACLIAGALIPSDVPTPRVTHVVLGITALALVVVTAVATLIPVSRITKEEVAVGLRGRA
jgi:ABC-type antimicrobial peptide transport system permease subunit